MAVGVWSEQMSVRALWPIAAVGLAVLLTPAAAAAEGAAFVVAKPAAKTEAKPVAKTDAKPAAKTDAKPAAKTDTEKKKAVKKLEKAKAAARPASKSVPVKAPGPLAPAVAAALQPLLPQHGVED